MTMFYLKKVTKGCDCWACSAVACSAYWL